MKIAELHLIAFGPFTDCRIDLSAGKHGLHIIYGPNEAGKSSSLRAVTDFLYGFPGRTADDFLHSYKNLRVGAQLKHSDGSQLSVVRRKAQKLSLRCSQDVDPVPDDALLPFLGDIDQDSFKSMFGINHQRLRDGGRDIANGKGHLGQMLFAAGAGVVNLQQLQNDLLAESEGLLKSTLRSGSIHQHLQDYLRHRQAVAAAQMTVDTWKHSDQQYREHRQEKAQLDQQLSCLNAQLARLQRIQLASTSINRWKSRHEKLHPLAATPRLADDFVQRTNDLLLELKTRQRQAGDAAVELDKLERQLQSLHVPQSILTAFEAIDGLRDRAGGIRRSLVDRPTVEAKREAAEREAQELMLELDRKPDLSTIEELRLPRDKKIKIQSLGTQLQLLLERLQTERKSCEQLRQAIATTQERLVDLDTSIDLLALRAALRAIQQSGDVQADLDQAEAQRSALQQQVDVALKKLPLFAGTAAELESLPLPSSISLDRFEVDFATADRQLQSLRQQLVEYEQKRDALSTRLAEIESGQVIPTLADLARLRKLRQQGWQLIHRAWQSATHDNTAVQDYLQNFANVSDLAVAYEQAVAEADRLADDLRTDADRVAMKSKLHTDLEQLLARETKFRDELQQAQTRRADIGTRWLAMWQPLGISPLPQAAKLSAAKQRPAAKKTPPHEAPFPTEMPSPAEMRNWLRQAESLTLLLQQLRQHQAVCAHKQKELTELTQRLQHMLGSLGLDNQEDNFSLSNGPANEQTDYQPTLSELTHRIDDKLSELTAQASRHEQWRDSLQENQNKLAAAQAQYADSEVAVGKLQREWAGEMARLGLEPNALPEQANSRLATLQELFEKFKEVDRYRARLEHIDSDAKVFADDVCALCATVALAHQSLPAEQALHQLVEQLEQARAADREQRSLLHRRTELTATLEQAQQLSEQATLQLDEMLRQASVSHYDELAPAAEKSRQRREHEQAIAELEDEIAGHCVGASLADFMVEVERELAQEQTLDQRLAQLQQQLAELNERRDFVIGQIREDEIELDKFDGSDVAAEANAQCESSVAQLDDELQALAVRSVATVILKAAIERHREKNQGPILGRASEIFSQITLGQFMGLQAEYDARGEPMLAGLRGSQHVLVDGMSDGTCDQLYLALRLASLEAWLAHHEPIPLIVDDILMNFDDARSVATLQVLAELSQRTQVIFFTHHQHLVELARKNLSRSELFITSIDSRAR